MTMTRRGFLSTVALPAAGLAALSAAGCSGGSGKTLVRFWNGFTGPDGITMLHLVQRFNAANPDVEVLMQRMAWATMYNKLFVAGLGGRAPELFVLHTRAIDRFVRAGFARNNDDLVHGTNGIDVSDLDANVWKAVDFGGRHYGLPLDCHATGMYYNAKLLRDAGMVDAAGKVKPPTDRASFLEAAQRATRKGKTSDLDEWGFVFTNWETNCYSIMRQYGGEFFTPDLSKCILNSPENIDALQFCVDLIRKYKVAPPPENFDAWIGFRQGRIAMAFEGIYMLADLQKQTDLEFGGAPLPVIGRQPGAAADTHNLCLRSDLTGRHLEATWRFMKFLSENSLDWAAGGQIPARKDLRATPRFQEMAVQSEFAREIPYVSYLPRLPFIFEFQTEFDLAIEKALRGRATPKDALDVAVANINAIILREKDTVLRSVAQGVRS